MADFCFECNRDDCPYDFCCTDCDGCENCEYYNDCSSCYWNYDCPLEKKCF